MLIQPIKPTANLTRQFVEVPSEARRGAKAHVKTSTSAGTSEDWQEHSNDAREDPQDYAEDWDNHGYYYDNDWAEVMVVGATVAVVATAVNDDYHETSTAHECHQRYSLGDAPVRGQNHGVERSQLLPVRLELVHARLSGRRCRLRAERPTSVEVTVQ